MESQVGFSICWIFYRHNLAFPRLVSCPRPALAWFVMLCPPHGFASHFTLSHRLRRGLIACHRQAREQTSSAVLGRVAFHRQRGKQNSALCETTGPHLSLIGDWVKDPIELGRRTCQVFHCPVAYAPQWTPTVRPPWRCRRTPQGQTGGHPGITNRTGGRRSTGTRRAAARLCEPSNIVNSTPFPMRWRGRQHVQQGGLFRWRQTPVCRYCDA